MMKEPGCVGLYTGLFSFAVWSTFQEGAQRRKAVGGVAIVT
jgi:hypothetical protein